MDTTGYEIPNKAPSKTGIISLEDLDKEELKIATFGAWVREVCNPEWATRWKRRTRKRSANTKIAWEKISNTNLWRTMTLEKNFVVT
jgi:ribonuclease HI